jgi:hypothetical protein
MIVGNGFGQLRQPIRHWRDAVGIVYKLAAMIGVRPFLPKCLVVFAVFESEVAAKFLELDTLDNQKRVPVLVVILKLGDDNFGLTGMILAVGLRRRSGERFACSLEVDAIEVLDKLDNVAANTAATTIKDLFLDIDGEAIFAAALWTSADAL